MKNGVKFHTVTTNYYTSKFNRNAMVTSNKMYNKFDGWFVGLW